MTPIIIMAIVIDVPPFEIKVIGIPDKGTKLNDADIL